MKTVPFAVCAGAAAILMATPVPAAEGGALPDTIDDVADLDGGPGEPVAPVPLKKPGSIRQAGNGADSNAARHNVADEASRIVERELPAPDEETLRSAPTADGARRARIETDLRRRAESEQARRRPNAPGRRPAPYGRGPDEPPGYAARKPPPYYPGRRTSRFAGYEPVAPYDAWEGDGEVRRWRIVRGLRARGFREPHGFRCGPLRCRLFAFKHGHLYRLVIDPRGGTVLRQRALDWY